MECSNCGAVFERQFTYQEDGKKFCSLECALKYYGITICDEEPCAECGGKCGAAACMDDYGHLFCGPSCALKYYGVDCK